MNVRTSWCASAPATALALSLVVCPPAAAQGRTAAAPASRDAASAAPGTGVWANYDFVPGDRVLFADDFTLDRVGDFPRRLELKSGNWDVAEWEGRRLLRNTGPRRSIVEIPLAEALPDRFTIEFDVYLDNPTVRLAVMTVALAPNQQPQQIGANYVVVRSVETGVATGGPGTVHAVTRDDRLIKSMTPIRIMVDGGYAKVYVDERRVANVPNARFPRGRLIQFVNQSAASESRPLMIGAIRIAAGGRDLSDVLDRDGRVATRGIYFDTGSAVIRPESSGTLLQIGKMLQDRPELRLSIEGHTDSDGDAADNLDLSTRRAAAVKAHLVAAFGVAAGRLEVEGRGETTPVADNASPEGKQQNRRVELVRLGR